MMRSLCVDARPYKNTRVCLAKLFYDNHAPSFCEISLSNAITESDPS